MDDIDTIKILKAGVGLVMGASVGHIVKEFVARVAPTETIMQKTMVTIGRTGISMAVSHAVCTHVEERIDETVDWFNKNFKH